MIITKVRSTNKDNHIRYMCTFGPMEDITEDISGIGLSQGKTKTRINKYIAAG